MQRLSFPFPSPSPLLLQFFAYRDIAVWWKYFLNPDLSIFPNNPLVLATSSQTAVPEKTRMQTQMDWKWNQQEGGYTVTCGGLQVRCAPNPATYAQAKKPMPTARWPSTCTPSFYVASPAIKGEDDVIYRKNLPTFADDETILTAGKTVEQLILETPLSKQHVDVLRRRSQATGRKVDATSEGKVVKAAKLSDRERSILSQRDSELLITFLTVPYLRMPLVLNFFASNDRIHKLCSAKLQGILDAVLFEPHTCLEAHLTNMEPVVVPTQHANLLASPYGLLLNELVHSPAPAITCVVGILKAALALDTGSVCDIDAFDFNVAVDIILYVARLGSRVDNYITFLLAYVDDPSDCTNGPLRGVEVEPDGVRALRTGQMQLRSMLQGKYSDCLEEYLRKLHLETVAFPDDEGLIDRNTRLACDLHAHRLLIHRNISAGANGSLAATDHLAAAGLLASFVFLTTRHTFGKLVRAAGQLLVPETELYEVLSTTRRALMQWCARQQQGTLDWLMQTALQISTSSTGSLRASGAMIDAQNRWSRIAGPRSIGRFVVSSVRTMGVYDDDADGDAMVTSSGRTTGSVANRRGRAAAGGGGGESKRRDGDGDGGGDGGGDSGVGGGNGDDYSDLSDAGLDVSSLPPQLLRMQSRGSPFQDVPESTEYGVELDLQLGQMTLRSRHLSALPSNVASHPDVTALFGDATIQASTIETSQHRNRYRLVGMGHEVQHWTTPHTSTPPFDERWERMYDPAELYPPNANGRWPAASIEGRGGHTIEKKKQTKEAAGRGEGPWCRNSGANI